MMNLARARERPDKHLRLEWEPSRETREREVAAEAVTALFTFIDSWLEPLAVEVRVGCYSSETFAESSTRPPHPEHLLIREPRLAEVEINSIYRSLESYALLLTKDSVQSWMDRTLAQSCDDGARCETSLRELDVLASQVLLPAGWTDGDKLPLECYAGTARIPVERRGDVAWVAAPPVRYGVRQPLAISIQNYDGWLWFSINIYWSPWVEELDRPESPLAQGVARLAARGWHPSSD